MCEFVSWIEYNNQVYFLTNNDLRGKRFTEYKKYNVNWKADIVGHGAIEYFYPELKGKHKECTDFSTPDNFPEKIVKAIKEGKLNKLGVSVGLLNCLGRSEYKKVQQPAYAEYIKVQPPAYAEYIKIKLEAFWELFSKSKYRNGLWK